MSTAHADDHSHHRFQAHHFETSEQQFQAGKLGMWLFLATEVLFFSAMFCAYAVYRSNHPEVFEKAAQFLNPYLGAANTLVLLASSLSVAWAVRCAQMNDRKGLLTNLIFTLFCAGAFMGVKSVEYGLKFKEGLFWRGNFSYVDGSHPDLTETHATLQSIGLWLLGIAVAFVVVSMVIKAAGGKWALFALGATLFGAGVGCLAGNAYTLHEEQASHHATAGEHAEGEEHAEEHAAEGEVAHTETTAEAPATDEAAAPADAEAPAGDPLAYGGEGSKFPGVFFSIYYAMTGVHAIHILAGIGVFVWIISRAGRGHFDSEYYGPVEYTGLYWHLVDLIWIYLFPLLYLIQ
ncbi:cytochrome c oxidase subunit 3 [Aeoliella mucimassa]|uniref:Cytochrome c oxidase subunit 3 n=1 Tax=Aeoliella mucimassa TaxID=2527972 RepID=A0A518AGY7_9BACT|nr:cytochrome c oxidase subunit 3 [Aeoliella mucimassa]QDU53987.1 Cytochrome c oxidase subunit 3 [Aeoliella mucimassa]